MSNHPEPQDTDTEALHGRIAEGLTPLAVPVERVSSLQQRLMARVSQSAARHRGLRTIRHGDAPWQTLSEGVLACMLHDNGATRSVLVEFAPGASLPAHRHAADEECIVLRGSLYAGDCRVALHDYHLAPAGSRHKRIRSDEGAVAFLRGTSIGRTGHMMREMATALLPGDGPQFLTIAAGSGGWREVAAGAFIKPLLLQGASASMLLRLEAGARLPVRPRVMEEECLMLSGEAFFGDVLLRSGEYQQASSSTPGGEAFSDVGALVYVHGDASCLQP